MIDLLAHDELAALGLQAILDLEKIPYRRILAPEEASASLLVVTGDALTPAEIAVVERTSALVLGGGDLFARQVFGATAPRAEFGTCTVGLDQPVWPRAVADIVRLHGKCEMRLPAVPFCDTSELTKGNVLATMTVLRSGASATRAAVARRNRCIWSLLDLGTAFANLMNEDDGVVRKPPTSSPWYSTARKAAEVVYYAAPDALRGWVQRRTDATLDQRLAALGNRASEYPIDPTGYFLVELLKHLIRLATGSLVRVARWPAPYQAAASLTHDVEPRRYAYTRGMDRLLETIEATGHPRRSVSSPVRRCATCATTWSTSTAPRRVLCHGLEHRGEQGGDAPASPPRSSARAFASSASSATVLGYRSPRLDRSPDLAWALDRAGFRYDSSYRTSIARTWRTSVAASA
jgi:hypothetical protein